MKEINIFIASSIVEFESERRELGDYIRSLNDMYTQRGIYFRLFVCEDFSKALSEKRKQDDYNEQIKNSHYFYIIFGANAGSYAVEEFDIALKNFKETGVPKIYTYFRILSDKDSYSESVLNFMNRLDKELGHYYSMFSHIDSIKLNILLELSKDPEFGGRVEIVDGSAIFNGKDIMEVSGMPIYAKNQTLIELNRQKSEEEENYRALCDMQRVMESNPAFPRMIAENEAKRYSIQRKISEVENEVLELCIKTSESRRVSDHRLNWREKKAIEYVDAGDYESAKKILEDPVWELELNRSINQAIAATQSIEEYINGQRMLIRTMSALGINTESEKSIEDIYEKIGELCIQYRIRYETLFDHALFLMTHNRHAKAIHVFQKLIMLYNIDGAKKQEIADAEYYLACLMYKVNNTTEAERLHLNVIRTREQLSESRTLGDKRKLSESYNQMGYLYYRMKKYELAEKYYNKALTEEKSLLESGLNANKEYALTLNNYALLQQHYGKNEISRKAHEEAVAIREKLGENLSVPSLGYLAMSYLNYARFIFDVDKDFEKAQSYMCKAINIYTEISKKDTKHLNDCAIAKFYYACMLTHIDFEKALIIHKEVLGERIKLAEANEKALQADISDSYFEIGRLLMDIGKVADAKTYLLKAYRIRKELMSVSPEKHKEGFERIDHYFHTMFNIDKERSFKD